MIQYPVISYNTLHISVSVVGLDGNNELKDGNLNKET